MANEIQKHYLGVDCILFSGGQQSPKLLKQCGAPVYNTFAILKTGFHAKSNDQIINIPIDRLAFQKAHKQRVF